MLYPPINFRLPNQFDITWEIIKDYDRTALRQYFQYGLPVGGLLKAILEQRLADLPMYPTGKHINNVYTMFFHRYCPPCSWGSPGMCEAWMKRGGLVGKEDVED